MTASLAKSGSQSVLEIANSAFTSPHLHTVRIAKRPRRPGVPTFCRCKRNEIKINPNQSHIWIIQSFLSGSQRDIRLGFGYLEGLHPIKRFDRNIHLEAVRSKNSIRWSKYGKLFGCGFGRCALFGSTMVHFGRKRQHNGYHTQST